MKTKLSIAVTIILLSSCTQYGGTIPPRKPSFDLSKIYQTTTGQGDNSLSFAKNLAKPE